MRDRENSKNKNVVNTHAQTRGKSMAITTRHIVIPPNISIFKALSNISP